MYYEPYIIWDDQDYRVLQVRVVHQVRRVHALLEFDRLM